MFLHRQSHGTVVIFRGVVYGSVICRSLSTRRRGTGILCRMVQQSDGRGKEAASVVFQRFSMEDAEHLADLLSEEHWPYHSEPTRERATVLARMPGYDSDTAMTFWVMRDGVREGFVRIFDLEDDTPMFDLRLRRRARGRGLGTLTVQWLVDHVFQTLPSVARIEATTRDDNKAMRRVLRACGFVKEAHYRSAWPSKDGQHDSIGYAILRTDWQSGTTTPVKWDDEAPAVDDGLGDSA